MMELRRILCPVDFSEPSRHALDQALTVARRYDSTVVLLYVYDVPAVAGTGLAPLPLEVLRLTDRDRGTLMAQLKAFLESEAAVHPLVEFAVDEGDTASTILNAANAGNADLLVLGTHGRSGIRRLVLGSVAEKVLRRATCPVLSVPPGIPDAVPTAAELFKRIVCAIDFSDCSLHALNFAMALAQETDARLTVLHAMEYEFGELPRDVRATSPGSLTMAELRRRCEEQSRQRLKEVVPDAVRAYCAVETMVSSEDTPHQAILRVAAGQMADLIVMGVRGRSAADIAFFGSTAQHVVRQATCPVLTLRGE